MRKLLIVAAIVSMTFVATPQIEAGRRHRRDHRSRAARKIQKPRRDGFFARLMELERRKNEFLFGWIVR